MNYNSRKYGKVHRNVIGTMKTIKSNAESCEKIYLKKPTCEDWREGLRDDLGVGVGVKSMGR